MTSIKPLVLTMGEPAGIGAEVTLATWRALRDTGPDFFILDDPDRSRAPAASTGSDATVVEITQSSDIATAFRQGLPVLARRLPGKCNPGVINTENSAAVIRSIEEAVASTKQGFAGGVVTNPVQKPALYAVGFNHPGHTEFLAQIAGDGGPVIMMPAGADLRVAPVTIHEPLIGALQSPTKDMIVIAAQATDAALRRDFGIPCPRLAIAGFNPHAGEGGAIGREDIDIVAPAMKALLDRGINARGPMAPRTMFTPLARQSHDVAICLHHDQAPISLKTLDPDGGVNITLGLSIIRTSPDHGTALGIAGKGLAHPGSMIAAIRMAAAMAEGLAERA